MTDAPRAKTLHEAEKAIVGDRDKSYGPPGPSFTAVARLWDDYLDARGNKPLEAGDVAAMMTLLKVARLATGSLGHHDSWVDIAGYAGCGDEVTREVES